MTAEQPVLRRPNSCPSPSSHRGKRSHFTVEDVKHHSRADIEEFSSSSIPPTPERQYSSPDAHWNRQCKEAWSVTTTPTKVAAGDSSSTTQRKYSNTTNTAQTLDTVSTAPSISPSQRESINPDEEPDPLEYRPITSGEGYMYKPLLNYYTTPNRSAEKEFVNATNPLVSYLEEQSYESFTVILTHAGYERRHAVPVILIAAADIRIEDAEQLIHLFNTLECKIIRRVFCYRGKTQKQSIDEGMQQYEDRADPGASIGLVGGNSSFSLGCYFTFKDAPNEHFALTVHHAISDQHNSIPLGSTPVQIQQPSSPDFDDECASLERQTADSINSPSLQQLKDELHGLKSLKLSFGEVLCSGFGVVEYHGMRVNNNWAIITVDSARVGKNRVSFPLRLDGSRNRWKPRDYRGIYITGIGDLNVGEYVTKAGRATGTTIGQVSFAYSKTKLEFCCETTSEYTILTRTPHTKVFSGKGDSGSLVVNCDGKGVGIVLGGTDAVPMALEGHENLGPVSAT